MPLNPEQIYTYENNFPPPLSNLGYPSQTPTPPPPPIFAEFGALDCHACTLHKFSVVEI